MEEQFYNEYERFYEMARHSQAFQLFCQNAFGMDFSQDGFSDIRQIEKVLSYIPKDKQQYHILDIGCGNGKLLGYLQKRLPAYIYGFDYSKNAIHDAKERFPDHSEFQTAAIGEIDYPAKTFDVILSMDTMYFAKDMTAFVGQINRWLKEDGVLIVGYQEGDVVPKTADATTTLLASALKQHRMPYLAVDITADSYEVLKNKRDCAMALKDAFEKENNQQWFDMLMGQTEYVSVSLNEFKTQMARYLYVVQKRNDQG